MKCSRTGTFLIMAGGTGGHIYPALAVAKYLVRYGHRVVWLGSRRGLEASIVPKAGIDIRFVYVRGLRKMGFFRWAIAPIMLMVAVCQCIAVISRLKPNAVMGMGGYVSGPGAIAAWLLRKPLLIHEQNSVLGFTNRLLKHFADVTMEAFPGTFQSKFGAIHTGNPVRDEIAQIEVPQSRLLGRLGSVRLLVLGGSQGALVFNKFVPQAIESLGELKITVLHQAGTKTVSVAKRAYGHRSEICIIEFIDDIAEAYAWADIVICRAGAITIAELACAGVPAILVPYPYATDDHQTTNAQFLSGAHAAFLIEESEVIAGGLGALLKGLIHDRQQLLSMATAARLLAMPEATGLVAGLCMEAAND